MAVDSNRDRNVDARNGRGLRSSGRESMLVVVLVAYEW